MGANSINMTPVHSETYAGQFSASPTGDSACVRETLTWPSGNVHWYRACVELGSALQNTFGSICIRPVGSITTNGIAHAVAHLAEHNQTLSTDTSVKLALVVANVDGTQHIGTDITVSKSAYHELKLKVDLSGAQPVYTWWLDGIQQDA